MSAATTGKVVDHHGDKYGTKYVEKMGELQERAQKHTGGDDPDKEETPAGGFDDTPLPDAPPGYTIRITFHRAENLPFSDFPSLSTDPYIHATFKTALPKRHKQDPDLILRTPTIHKNTNPQWETQWVIANVPASGFFLKCRLYDEDPTDHDDRLGNVHVNVRDISEGWGGIKEQTFEMKKRMGSKRAYTLRGIASVLNKSVKMSGRLILSVENLGRTPGESGSRCYTVGPLPWTRHHSPLIGRIAGTKDREGEKGTERYNFQAIQMQLRGPVPKAMYHRYVEFKPFIAGMFTDVTLRGRILNRALHHQHARIYNFDTSTIYGIFEKPCMEMTKQLLEFCHYDQGGRIYTYVLSLDGLLRFTETGKEFGVDMLSKHTMHSDVSIYIAFSGEFFIRRLKHPHNSHRHHSRGPSGASDASAASGAVSPLGDLAPPGSEEEETSDSEHQHRNVPKDPAYYELIIDNDSGTYRPNKDLLPYLRDYFKANFPGLRVTTLDCNGDKETMDKLKEEQREHKKHSGKQITYLQNSSMDSLSSSDEEDLELKANGAGNLSGYKKQMAKLNLKGKKMSHSRDKKKARSGPEQPYPSDGATAHSRHPSSHDSRDYSSDNSAYQLDATQPSTRPTTAAGEDPEEEAERRNSGGYKNREMPDLLKKDHDGQMPRPQENEEGETKTKDGPETQYGELETGEHRPAGGIVYGAVVDTTSVEKGAQSKKAQEDKAEKEAKDEPKKSKLGWLKKITSRND